MIKIKIDPGHGGKDPGAVANGLQEKDVVLVIAKKTADYLNRHYENVQATLTRSADVFHELSVRAKIANQDKADYFVSIHLNSFKVSSNGFETFCQPGAGKETSAFQQAVHNQIFSFLKPYGIKDRGIKQKNLAVLRETNMPAVLTENLFVSNPHEAALLKKPEFLDGLAKAHAEGIAKGASLKKKTLPASVQPSKTQTPGLFRIYTGTFETEEKAEDAAKKNSRTWL